MHAGVYGHLMEKKELSGKTKKEIPINQVKKAINKIFFLRSL